MKLNKFLVVAAAAAVLPLSVANAEGPTSSNGPAETPVVEPQPGFPEATDKPISLKGDGTVVGKPEFKGGVNGPELVQPELKPYGTSAVAPLVNEKPEYKFPKSQGTFKVEDGKTPAKAQNGQKALPKTSAVK